MNIEKTCGNCKNVNFDNNTGWGVFGCKETGYVIPHQANYESKKVTFWRIPESCPKTTGVKKSEKQAPKSEWIIKSFSDFE